MAKPIHICMRSINGRNLTQNEVHCIDNSGINAKNVFVMSTDIYNFTPGHVALGFSFYIH